MVMRTRVRQMLARRAVRGATARATVHSQVQHILPHMEGEKEVMQQTATSRARQQATHVVAKTSLMEAAMVESYPTS